MKKLLLIFAAAFLLFSSCSVLGGGDISLNIVNNTGKNVEFTYIDQDTDPEFPITVSAGTSRTIDLSAKYEDYRFKFVYEGVTYKDGFYPCGHDVTYRLYLDSDSNLTVDFGSGDGSHPNTAE